MKVDYLRVQVGGATCEAFSGNLEVSGTIPVFVLYTGKPRKTCVEMAGLRTFRLLTSSQPSDI